MMLKTADVAIFNTCAVRENAELKVFGYIGALKNIKAQRPDMLIGICGCMIQQKHIAEKIKKTYEHVDMVFGTHSLYRFPEIMYNSMNNRIFDIEDADGHCRGYAAPADKFRNGYGFGDVRLQQFLLILHSAYVRGRERSRKHEDIINEVKNSCPKRCREVTLVGQNVNSYGKDRDEIDFADLLELVSEVEGIQRIRFVSAHPKDMSDKFIKTVARLPKVCNQLHVPFQWQHQGFG